MAQVFAQKTNRAFWQTVLAVIAALATLVFASLKTYQASSLYLLVLIHKIKDACGCASMAQFFAMHPDIFRAVILFAIGISVFILYSLYKLVRLYLQTKKYIAYYLFFAKARHSAKLKSAIKALGLDAARVIEIKNSESMVFCFGFGNPMICLSSALVRRLSKNELRAVLAHEAQHMVSYEPLKIFIIKYARSTFFFLPGIKTSARKYMTLSELAADEQASESAAARSDLASAILKISEQKENLWLKKGASFSSFNPALEERANRLSDESYVPKFKFLDRSLIVGSLGLAMASLVFIFIFSTSTKAFEMHNISSCVTLASQESDLACSVPEIQENIFNLTGADFPDISRVDFGEHFACETK